MSVTERGRREGQFAGGDLSWISVSLVNGEFIASLPGLQCNAVEYHLMEATTADATLPWDSAPVNWEQATLVGGVAVLLLQDEQPIWGGLLTDRQRTPDGEAMSLKLTTAEDYLNACPVGDVTYKQRQQTWIMADLVSRYAIDGMRNCLTVSRQDSATLRDRQYKDESDKSILSAIQELSKVGGGPEFRCTWRTQSDGTFRCVVDVADRIGSTDPVTSLELASMSSFCIEDEYAAGSGANRVRAVSTAEGDIRPSSGWIDFKDPTRPVWPYSYTPSTSITDLGTLESHARAKLAQLSRGTRSMPVELDLLTAPRLGVEWQPGDTVRWDVSEASDRYPEGTSGVARIIGYRVSWQDSWHLSPILQGDTDEQ